AEHHADRLLENGVVYFNSDSNTRGWLNAAGSHSLERFIAEVARDVPDPQRGTSVLLAAAERRRAAEESESESESEAESESVAEAEADSVSVSGALGAFELGALGSGSDYTAFLDHLGLASVHMSYGGDAPAGIYHSKYDSFDHYRRFQDTTFQFGVAEAQTLATAVLRMADAPVLPFEFLRVVQTYRDYVDEIEEGAAEDSALAALDLSEVRAALDALDRAATRYELAFDEVRTMPADWATRNRAALEEVNRLLFTTERALTDEAGLPGREWFHHLLYAPGFYTGYGVKTMPGIREAVEDVPDLGVARRQTERVVAALTEYAARVEAAAMGLEELL
ncbi:MAG: transferrin receptor-like dimerization domain-containing protein, partial [Longimicrobiales bacterium]